MKTVAVLVFLTFVSVTYCDDLVVGEGENSTLVWLEKVSYIPIPFIKRVKEIFYANPNQLTIRGIFAKDLDHSAAKVSITAGGIGFSYANLKLKSERGCGLNYQIEYYV